jgi:plastocyanin
MRNATIIVLIITTITAGCLSGTAPDSEGTDLSDVGNNTVIYNSSGFFPQTLTVETGETVTWQSDGPSMWVASDQHPTHTEYAGTTLSEHCSAPSSATSRFDACEDTDEYTFTFGTAGEWGYHNHLRSSHTGTIVVE